MKRTLLSVPLIALLVLLQPPRVEATPVISAPFVTVAVGDTFLIPISITDAGDLAFFQFDLAFAPLIVSADPAGATPGPMLPADWFFASPGIVDNSGGNILGVSAFGSPFSGSGIIAYIEFTALEPGVSGLTFSNVFLNLSDQGFEILNGQITVTGAKAPEPATLALLTVALFAFGVRRRMNSRRGDEC